MFFQGQTAESQNRLGDQNRLEDIEIFLLDGSQDFAGEMRIDAGNLADLLAGKNPAPAKMAQSNGTRRPKSGAFL